MKRFASKIFPRTMLGKVMTVYFMVCLAMVSFPGTYIANKINPYILGMPFFFFWCILWSLVFIPAGLIYLYIKEEKRGRKK